MTHRTAAQHNVMGLVEPFGADKVGLVGGERLGIVFDRRKHWRGGEPHDRDKDQRCGAPGPVRVPGLGVHRVEIMPDRDPHQKNQRGDNPAVFSGEGQRIVVRQHQEDDRQGEIVVMGRSQLGDLAVFGIRDATGLEIGHHDLLVRDDNEKHIRRHDRRCERAQMQQRRATGEDLVIPPAHHHQNAEQEEHQCRRMIAQGRFAELVIDHPADR